ncbi:MAG: hypothetical protein ACK4E8_03690 [Lacibacter sp.]
MRIIEIIFLAFLSSKTFAQTSKISLEANYGINGNFFVANRDEQSGPTDKTYFYKKNFIGTIGGFELTYKTGIKSSLFIGYNRSVNASSKNHFGQISNVDISIRDFTLRDINSILLIGYRKGLFDKKYKGSFELGPVLMYSAIQDIMIENWDNIIFIDESNFKNSQSVEGGLFVGFQIARKIDNHFDIGLRFRTHYLISVSSLEMITLTPTLTYRF